MNLKIPDKELRNSILQSGLTIWIDMDDRKNTKMGIKYTKQATMESPGMLELSGFTSEQERRFSAENPDNFSATMEVATSGTLYFELVMPVVRLPMRNSKDGHGAMPFSIGMETGDNTFWINHVKPATSQP